MMDKDLRSQATLALAFIWRAWSLERAVGMRLPNLLATLFLAFASSVLAATSPIQITEFAAAGHQGIVDEDGDSPDWIEIQNISASAVNLDGWTLSNGGKRRDEWRFPATNMPSGGFLVVYASGKDRRNPGKSLHTNFKLKSEGGDLALRGPGGEMSQVEHYPEQVAGVSFGTVGSGDPDTGDGNRQVLVSSTAELNYYLAVNDRLGTNWIAPAFNDAKWKRGQNGIGYATQKNSYRGLLQTDVGTLMAGRTVGLYLRIPFLVASEIDATSLMLRAQYDDGFVAWLNGVEVARRNAPETLSYDSMASATHPDAQGVVAEKIPINASQVRLTMGTNWLAVQVLNVSATSSDILFRTILDASEKKPTVRAEIHSFYSYLATPTPGRPNSAAICVGPYIQAVSHASLAKLSGPIDSIPITARVTPASGAVAQVILRYRIMFGAEMELPMFDDGGHGDGAPGDGIYGAAIPVKTAKPGEMVRYYVSAKDNSGRISRWPLFASRARYSAYQGTVIPDPSVQTRLPVVHLFTSNQRSSGPDNSLLALFYEGELYDNISLSHHGQISRGFPKPSYNVDFPRDHHFRYQANRSRVNAVTLLTNFADKSKIRNTISYEVIAAAGSIGHFAFPVRVQKNGKFYSVSEIIEHGDERWMERVGRDPGGALYKMYDSLNGGNGGEKKTRKQENRRDLSILAGAMAENKPLAVRATYAYDHLDLPQCVSYLAALALISSGDNGHKNYYLYCDTRGSGEWALLPWDVDLTWGRNWTGEIFNETLFVDNPLTLYRGHEDRGRNRLYNLIFEHEEFRQMYLRRLRTVMDEVLQPPGTPAQSLILERRIRELTDLLDPPDIKPSDATLDENAWPQWGDSATMRSEAQRIINQYLPGRRNFLFRSSRARLHGDPIPAAQPGDVTLSFSSIETHAPAAEQFVCISNQNDFAVDITNWRLAGAGIEQRFRPGTVIPAGKALYAVADARAFRMRTSGPSGGQSLFVEGNWKGELKSGGGGLQLIDGKGRVVVKGDIR